MTPIETATGSAGKPIKTGRFPFAIAITPDGKTTYVVNQFSMVTPITIATNTSGTPIKAGARPHAILIVP